jgi:hypothetical protein
MTTINIYPDCPKPEWMAVGAWCYCLGEGRDRFTVGVICDKAAALINAQGEEHGLESFTKLYQDVSEIKCYTERKESKP